MVRMIKGYWTEDDLSEFKVLLCNKLKERGFHPEDHLLKVALHKDDFYAAQVVAITWVEDASASNTRYRALGWRHPYLIDTNELVELVRVCSDKILYDMEY